MKFLAGVRWWAQLQHGWESLVRAGLAMAGRRQKVSELTKTRRHLQRPMGFVHTFVQARKILKAAGTKKVSTEERNAPRNVWWVFALWPCGLLCLTQQLRTPALWSRFPCSGLVLLFCFKCNFKVGKFWITLDEFTWKKRLTPGLQGISYIQLPSN